MYFSVLIMYTPYMDTIQKQGIIFLAGLVGLLLLGIFSNRPHPISASETNNKVNTEQKNQTSSCDGATQWTPHGPYVGPVTP